MQPLLAEHFRGEAMCEGCQVSISDLEMEMTVAGWIALQSPSIDELKAGCRRPCQQGSRLLYQLPDHFTDPRNDGSTLATQTSPAVNFNAACLEVQCEASAATVPDSAQPDTDNAGPVAQQHCLAFPPASRHQVCPACSTLAELLIQKRFINTQGTEELAKKVAYTQRKVQAMESQVLHLLQQQQDANGALWHGLLAEMNSQQQQHVRNVEQLLHKVDILAESMEQLSPWQ